MIFGRGGSPEPPWRLKLARLPLWLAASPRSFTFYLADPSARLRSCNGCEATARLSIASTCLIEPLWWRACPPARVQGIAAGTRHGGQAQAAATENLAERITRIFVVATALCAVFSGRATGA